ncbi:hypothetical protein QM007_01100 [Rothia sp. SD9660Na]|uniref:hypothetical protein n=1 Tax=Rothia sp. SD9660Na TaxID=3047030 RepID=UPI0024BA8070|nr:hypothetical protein [Rothia sp. SD9660Na]WHS50614.1 hypothetical protein QM007_01100 [Rothia sp. SD9660Na]
MTNSPTHTPSKDPIVIGASPAAALVIGLGYGSMAWGIYADSTWLGFVSIFLGGVGLEMARFPWQGKYVWHAAGILLLGLAGTILGTFLFYSLLPESIAFTAWGTAALHAGLAYMLYLLARRILPVRPPYTGKHSK